MSDEKLNQNDMDIQHIANECSNDIAKMMKAPLYIRRRIANNLEIKIVQILNEQKNDDQAALDKILNFIPIDEPLKTIINTLRNPELGAEVLGAR